MPMKNRTRIRIASGIYRDHCGLAGTVKSHGVQRESRFPPDTDLDVIKRWQVQTRAELDRERPDPSDDDTPAPVRIRGTFSADVPRYLLQIKGRVGYKADRSHLTAWLAIVGHLLRTNITAAHVRRAMATWQLAGKSPRTVRHRVRVLRELYQTLDGKHAKSPTLGVKLPRPADPHPTAVSIKVIQKVATSLLRGLTCRKRCGPTRVLSTVRCADPKKTHARFLVRATTGQRPSQLMRAKREDIDLKRLIWFVRAGKGGTAVPLPLNADMVRAWRAFLAADAFGKFDARSFSKTIRRHGWPKGIRPYALRHTFAIDHLRAGTNLGDLQGLLGHRQIETTRKFYAPIQLARLTKASGQRKLRLAS
jgi:integrase